VSKVEKIFSGLFADIGINDINLQKLKPRKVMPTYEVLLQINVSQEEEDNGFDVREFLDFSEAEDVQDVKVRIMNIAMPHFTIQQLIDFGLIS
jgi:uncharacterized pyridoxal phosphate-containing UPF0001 family protein